jgi:hypothetical protein
LLALIALAVGRFIEEIEVATMLDFQFIQSKPLHPCHINCNIIIVI